MFNIFQIKRRFTSNMSLADKFIIPANGIPNNQRLGVVKGRYYLPTSEVRDIFEPVIVEVIELVKKQISISNTKIKAVLLVGGFGASTYLCERLRAAIDNDILILQPPNAWSAVVRGAVLKGLAINSPEVSAVSVHKRKARSSYGIELNVCFDEKKHAHLKKSKYWSDMEGQYRVRVMHWFVKRVSCYSPSQK